MNHKPEHHTYHKPRNTFDSLNHIVEAVIDNTFLYKFLDLRLDSLGIQQAVSILFAILQEEHETYFPFLCYLEILFVVALEYLEYLMCKSEKGLILL